MPRTIVKSGPDDYISLVRAFPLRRITSDAAHEQALRVSGRLLSLVRKLTRGESDYLDALVVLIQDYEQRKHQNFSTIGGLDLLKHLMGESGMTQRELAKLLGVGEGAASMILSGERDLTKFHIAVLSKHFAVGPAAFF
jgi:antitoxin component HigA of HigAB toxin-antitoxin module